MPEGRPNCCLDRHNRLWTGVNLCNPLLYFLQRARTELIGSLIVLLLSCLLVVWLAARICRVGLLMYGKRPTLKELGHWIRYA